MKLVICTKFQVNRMNCVESRWGGGFRLIPTPPLKASCNYFFFEASLLGLRTRRSKTIDKSIDVDLPILPSSISLPFLLLSLLETSGIDHISSEQIRCKIQSQNLRTEGSKTIDKSIDFDLPISLSENRYVFFQYRYCRKLFLSQLNEPVVIFSYGV